MLKYYITEICKEDFFVRLQYVFALLPTGFGKFTGVTLIGRKAAAILEINDCPAKVSQFVPSPTRPTLLVVFALVRPFVFVVQSLKVVCRKVAIDVFALLSGLNSGTGGRGFCICFGALLGCLFTIVSLQFLK